MKRIFSALAVALATLLVIGGDAVVNFGGAAASMTDAAPAVPLTVASVSALPTDTTEPSPETALFSGLLGAAALTAHPGGETAEDALRNKQAAAHNGCRIQRAREEARCHLELTHETVRKFLRFDELFIGMAELVDLDMFVAKALHHANAAQRILQTRVQTRHAHTILAEDYALAVVLDKRIRCHDSRHRQHHQCKRNIDEHQQREGTHDFQGCDKEVLGTVVGHLRNVKQIGNQLRHHFAGVIAVVIRKAQTLILPEQIHAHPHKPEASSHCRPHS